MTTTPILSSLPPERALAPVFYPALDENPAAVYLAHLRPGGRRTMRQALDVIAALLTNGQADALSCPWAALRFQHTAAVRAALAEAYSPATANKMLSALRGTLKTAWRLRQMTAEDYRRAADIETIKGRTLPAGRELEPPELASLLRACGADPTPAGRRDAAVVSLLYSAGLRREEAATLDLADYDPATGKLRVRGKGTKERTVYVLGGAVAALDAWLARRGESPGALFWPITKTGKLLPRRLSSQAVYDVLRRRGKQAGLAAFSPHDLRRTFVSDLLDAGADIATVAHLAGHANVQTTARYDRRPEAAKRQAAALLQVPYPAAAPPAEDAPDS